MRIKYGICGSVMCGLLLLPFTIGWCGGADREAVPAAVSRIAHFIATPMTRQYDGYTCGVTALQSILGYYGVDQRLDQLALALKPDPEKGTHYLRLAVYARSLGFEAEIRNEMTLTELQECIDQKKPVLLAIQAWADSRSAYSSTNHEDGHYVVAVGYDDKNFYFMDPSTLGHYTYIPVGEFVSRWHDYDSFGKKVLKRFGMIIAKRGISPYDPEEIRRLD